MRRDGKNFVGENTPAFALRGLAAAASQWQPREADVSMARQVLTKNSGAPPVTGLAGPTHGQLRARNGLQPQSRSFETPPRPQFHVTAAATHFLVEENMLDGSIASILHSALV